MLDCDIDAVLAIAAEVHPDFPEGEAVFREKLALFPDGCRMLIDASGQSGGYLVAHPWHKMAPPPLDSLLGAVPASGTFYFHDLALLPASRGTGAGKAIVEAILADAARLGFDSASLVAVNGSAPFWQAQGFVILHDDEITAKLASYGEDARFMARGI
jgi:GNAT superfamily N-acetyltransferase